MDCKQCGATLPEDAEFCNACGSPVSPGAAAGTAEPGEEMKPRSVCRTCGNPLAADARFCATCGTFVGQSSTAEQEATMVESPAAARAGTSAGTAPDAPTQRMGQWSPPPPQSGPPGWTPQPGYYAGPDWFSQTAARLKRVFLLDASLYQEVRTDSRATSFSITAAVLGMFAFALGGFLWTAIDFEGDWEIFWKSALVGTLIGLALWGAGLGVTVGVLMNVFHKAIRFDEALRVSGAATAVLALGFFMLIPGITFGVALVAVVLWIVNSVFAMRAAFGLDDRQAIAAGLAGFAVWALVLPLIVSSENPLGPGIFLMEWARDVIVQGYGFYIG